MPDIDKRLVGFRFGKRVLEYDAVTPVQRAMQEELLAHALARLGDRPVRSILELGCGTGGLTSRLVARFPQARIVAIDLAAEMVAHVRGKGLPVDCHVADAEEYVRDSTARHDLVISNASLQWFTDPRGTLQRCLGLLDDGGVCAVSTFGERTFTELAAAFDAAYRAAGRAPRRHVLPFVSTADWQAWFPRADLRQRQVQCAFPDVRTFLRTVQDAGAALSVDQRQPIPRQVLATMREIYHAQFPAPPPPAHSPSGNGDHWVRATYHILMLVAGADPVASSRGTTS